MTGNELTGFLKGKQIVNFDYSIAHGDIVTIEFSSGETLTIDIHPIINALRIGVIRSPNLQWTQVAFT
jgi:hypothetical protein